MPYIQICQLTMFRDIIGIDYERHTKHVNKIRDKIHVLNVTVGDSYDEPGSSVGIATDYGLDGPGSNPGGDEIFRPSRPALKPTQPPVQWVPELSRE